MNSYAEPRVKRWSEWQRPGRSKRSAANPQSGWRLSKMPVLVRVQAFTWPQTPLPPAEIAHVTCGGSRGASLDDSAQRLFPRLTLRRFGVRGTAAKPKGSPGSPCRAKRRGFPTRGNVRHTVRACEHKHSSRRNEIPRNTLDTDPVQCVHGCPISFPAPRKKAACRSQARTPKRLLTPNG